MRPPFPWVDADFLKFLPFAGELEQHRFGRNMEEAVRRAGISHIIVNSETDPVLAGIDERGETPAVSLSQFDGRQFVKRQTSLIKVVDAGRKGKYVVRRVLPPGNS
jgi:hypothetical protein